MLEITIHEAMPDFNTRTAMGRVVVPPPPPTLPKSLPTRETSRVFLCCNRIFLTAEALENHRLANVSGTTSKCYIDDNKDGPSRSQAIQEYKLRMTPSKDIASFASIERDVKVRPSEVDMMAKVERIANPNHGALDKTDILATDKLKLHENSSRLKSTEFVFTADLSTIPRDVKDIRDKTDGSLVRKSTNSPWVTCELCQIYKAPYMGRLKAHKKASHKATGEHLCEHCSCRFQTKLGLVMHLRAIHKIKNAVISTTQKEGATLDATTIQVPAKCPLKSSESYSLPSKSQICNLRVTNLVRHAGGGLRDRNTAASKSKCTSFKCIGCPKGRPK